MIDTVEDLIKGKWIPEGRYSPNWPENRNLLEKQDVYNCLKLKWDNPTFNDSPLDTYNIEFYTEGKEIKYRWTEQKQTTLF